jgi:hypothetical protein
MPSNLTTDWIRIGRSGHTAFDGRKIKKEWIVQAAENYDPNKFKALIWPEHRRWFNLGTVEELRAEDNDEGGVDLFARISPNDYYLSMNREGQKLFTSMELEPSFKGKKGWYLCGLGATDDPASTDTTEVRFSALKDIDKLIGDFIEVEVVQFNSRVDRDEPDDDFSEQTFFKRMKQFFMSQNTDESQGDDEMSKKELEELKVELSAIKDALKAFNNNNSGESGDDDSETPDDMATQFAALKDDFDELKTQFKALSGGDDDKTKQEKKFAQLEKTVGELSKKLFAALNDEHDATESGEHTGDEENSDTYI